MTSREQFEEWKGYPLPALNADGQYPKEYLQREWCAWQASRTSIVLPAPCPEKTVGPNPFRSNYAVGWDECLEATRVAIGSTK